MVGSIFLVCLIYFGEQERTDCDTDGYNSHGQSTKALSAIWRTFYFVGLIFVLMVLMYRGLVLEEGKGHKRLLARKERRRKKLGHGNSYLQILWFYGEEHFFFHFQALQRKKIMYSQCNSVTRVDCPSLLNVMCDS